MAEPGLVRNARGNIGSRASAGMSRNDGKKEALADDRDMEIDW
jgi:hypothetical protein